MLELVAGRYHDVEASSSLGQRIRAVGVCFYKKRGAKKGNNYQLRRNSDNPKDTNCFEVRSQEITMATMSLKFSADALSKITIYAVATCI